MSDFDALTQAEKDLTSLKTNGRWLGFGLLCTGALVLLGVWGLALYAWPIVIGSITGVIASPFLFGFILLKVKSSKVNHYRKMTNKKDDAVEL